MKKRKNEIHTKGWTLFWLLVHIGILALEVFGAYWLLIIHAQAIAYMLYLAFLVLPSITAIIVYWVNYIRKSFLCLIESDLKEDQRLAEQYGVAYYVWKALTLPYIVNKQQNINEGLVETCVDLIIEREELKKQLTQTEKALELACERVKYFEEMQDKEMGFSEFFGYDSDYDLKAIIEQYKEQAKEKKSE